VVQLQPQSAPPVQTSGTAQPANNDLALELGAGALALLALGGAAMAVSRRRRSIREEAWEEEPSEPVAEAEPVAPSQPIAAEEPPMTAPPMSAFAWDNEPRGEQSADDDRRHGETWVERAYRGPSANNPSVSLRNRLGRAAFFDKREREVAAGTAEPVDADAGLPEAMVEQQADERELESN
jgi:hypothetical protein